MLKTVSDGQHAQIIRAITENQSSHVELDDVDSPRVRLEVSGLRVRLAVWKTQKGVRRHAKIKDISQKRQANIKLVRAGEM